MRVRYKVKTLCMKFLFNNNTNIMILRVGDVMKKKMLIFVITFLMLITSSGCPSGNDGEDKGGSSNNKVQVKQMDKKSVRAFMDNYMRRVVEGDKGAIKSFYSKELSGKVSSRLYSMDKDNPIVVGYKLEDGEEKEDKMEVKAHIFSEYVGKPYFSDDTFSYTLINEDQNIVIDKIKKELSTEIYEGNKFLYKREGEALKGTPIISIKDLPYYVVIGGDDSLEQKVSVPREDFGPCAVSPEGDNIIITTTGKDKGTLIALVKQKEEGGEEQTINIAQGGGGGDSSGGGNGGGSQGQSQEGQGQGEGSQGQQEQSNMTFKPVDVFSKEKVDLITFSPDGKMFAIQIKKPSGVTKIIVYKEENGEIIKSTVNHQFGDDKFLLQAPYFISSDELLFTVIPAKNATVEERKFKGQWMMDLKNSKIKQIR